MTEREYLDRAMSEAEYAYRAHTYPVGAIIVDPNGKVISEGHNRVYSDGGNFTSHAEVEAIRNAGDQLMKQPNFNACTLYTTMEPCLMCSGAILMARIARVIWVLDDDLHGALRRLRDHDHPLSDYYSEKIATLTFHHAEEHDLIQRMASLMETWNGAKESRLSQLR